MRVPRPVTASAVSLRQEIRARELDRRASSGSPAGVDEAFARGLLAQVVLPATVTFPDATDRLLLGLAVPTFAGRAYEIQGRVPLYVDGAGDAAVGAKLAHTVDGTEPTAASPLLDWDPITAPAFAAVRSSRVSGIVTATADGQLQVLLFVRGETGPRTYGAYSTAPLRAWLRIFDSGAAPGEPAATVY